MLLHALADRWGDPAMRVLGHLGTLVAAVLLFVRLLVGGGAIPVLVNGQALVDMGVIVSVCLAAWALRMRPLVPAYRIAAWIGLLGWLWRDLVALPEGQAYVSVAWAVCALGLLTAGWLQRSDTLRVTALATLAVVIAKLFLVDLVQLEALWRIVLFLGFGMLLLLLSYLFPNLLKTARDVTSKTISPPDE